MEKTRDQIDSKYKWTLEDVYASSEDFDKEYDFLNNEVAKVKNYEKNFLKSSKDLYEFLLLDEKLIRILEKLNAFAYMRSDEDKGNNKGLELIGKMNTLETEYNKAISFARPAMLEKDYSLIESFYKEMPELKKWEVLLKDIYRFKEYTLTKEEEKIIAGFSKILNASDNTYSVLCNSDMKFDIIKDENGKEITLTESNYNNFIRSKDRNVRINAFTKLHVGYEQFKNTFASTLSSIVDSETTISQIKHYKNSLDASLFLDEIETSVYLNLIDSVKKGLPVLFDYFKFKKEKLKLDEFHLYDSYVDLIEKNNKTYTYEEAKSIVINALSILGEDYVSNLNKAFTEGWIDVYPNKGKTSGAYSSGSYDTKPYILLNYERKLNDVSTLAHELGHSMHSFYSRTNNEYPTSNYVIFVAEVASIVNELLLSRYLLKNTTDKNEKLVISNNLLDTFKATIFRQTMFAEFEMKIHALNEQGKNLTSDLLSNIYYDLNKEYFGDDVVVDEQIKYEWIRIPHFYTPFYVYKYATGLSAACKIATDILSGKENARENYLEFLKSGNRKAPIELLKIAGVDMNDPEVVNSAIKMFKDTLEEFKKEINS